MPMIIAPVTMAAATFLFSISSFCRSPGVNQSKSLNPTIASTMPSRPNKALTVNALTASDSVLIPLQCEYLALEGLTQLIGAIRLVQDHLNPALRIEGVLLTMFDARLNLSQQVADEARKFFSDRVYKAVIPRNVKLSEAPSFGKPIVLYDPHSSGAESYRELAREVLEHE